MLDSAGPASGLLTLLLVRSLKDPWSEPQPDFRRIKFHAILSDVVAFLRKTPELTPEEYQALIKNAPTHEEMMQQMDMGNSHRPGPQSHQ